MIIQTTDNSVIKHPQSILLLNNPFAFIVTVFADVLNDILVPNSSNGTNATLFYISLTIGLAPALPWFTPTIPENTHIPDVALALILNDKLLLELAYNAKDIIGLASDVDVDNVHTDCVYNPSKDDNSYIVDIFNQFIFYCYSF